MEREKRSCGERLCINEPGGLPCSAVLPVLRLPIFNFLDINNKSEPISDWIKVRIVLIWWRRRGSNSRPYGCEPYALPAELRPRIHFLTDCRRTDRRKIPPRPTFCGAAAAHDGMRQPCGYCFEQMLLYHILLKKSTVISLIFNGEDQTDGDCSL